SNGKIDRKALPIPEEQAGSGENHLSPVEELIASVWSQVLGVSNIGAQDSFFELGGHSLLATQVVSRLQEAFQIELPLRELFEHSTVETLASRIGQLRQGDQKRELPPLVPVERGEAIPLSYAQQRLWFIDRFTPNSALYNIPAVWRLTGDWALESLEKGWNQLLERHESLRTVIQEIDDQPVQQIRPYSPETIPVMNVTELPKEARDNEMKRIIQNEAEAPFDLGQGPLIRVQILQVEEKEWMLLCTMHHIISDGWSMEVLLDEWMALYEEDISGTPAELSPLPVQYADFAQWQREWLKEDVLEQQLQYWKEELSGDLPILQLPTDRPRPAVQTNRGKMHQVLLSHPLREKLKEMSRQEGSTLFMTLLTAYQSFLSRYTGQEDILVGSPIANRNYREIEGLIGFFVNTLVYRADMTGNPTFQELLSQVREKALRAHEYQDVPFEKIVEVVQTERSTSHSPIFQTMFTMQDTPRKQRELVGRSLEMVEIHTSIAKFDLTLSMADLEEGLFLAFEYNTDLFDPSTIERMTGHFENWLHEIVHHPDAPLSGLTLISKEEQKQLLEEWNDTKVEYSYESTIHERFEEQVLRTPEAVAVVYEDRQLTYRELNEQANQLAHYLQKRGVGPESLIGLCVERSPEMMIGLLGILKAGGAYVPLDPAYPEQRLQYILADAGIRVLVTTESLQGWLPQGIEAICLDRDQEMIAQESTLSPIGEATAKNVMYVIYTSGSTGNPKGVMVEHHSVM
ncbi:condensation domain-containing protein, partial [Thermoactinomyces sp. DSM 45892]|uniref:condensation domain-containing protein n=1 Tax=Thermoactinomyces sp. DSM 45892 TaxID=1882753 RepID=UPI00089666D2